MKAQYLVTAIGGDIGSSVVRCLSKEFSKERLAGCDITPYVSGYSYVGDFFLVPPYKEEKKYIDVLLYECKKRSITHILPMTEGEIKIFDKYREVFAEAGLKIMINSSNILKIAFSKYDTAKAVKRMGLNSPKTWKCGDCIDGIIYPVIIKPDTGCGSRDIRVVRDFQEYKTLISQASDAVVQEYIGTSEEEYTVGVFSDGKEVKEIAFRRTLGFGGMSRMVELVEDESIHFIAETVAAFFELKGALNLQMRKQKGEYYIFEINPRISSTVGFRYRLGFKDIKWWLDLLDGKTEKIVYTPEKPPVVGIRTLDEKIFKGDLQMEKVSIEKKTENISFGGGQNLKTDITI